MAKRKHPIPLFKLVIHYTCLAPVLVAFGLTMFFPHRMDPDPPFSTIPFFLLLFLSFLTFPILGILDQKFLHVDVLKRQFRRSVDATVVSLKTGLMGAASIAAFSAFLGISNYLIDRELGRLWVFLGIWLIQYLLALHWLKRGYEDINRIARQAKKASMSKGPRKKKKKSKKSSRTGKESRSASNH